MNSDNPIYLKIFCIIFPKEKKKGEEEEREETLSSCFLNILKLDGNQVWQ